MGTSSWTVNLTGVGVGGQVGIGIVVGLGVKVGGGGPGVAVGAGCMVNAAGGSVTAGKVPGALVHVEVGVGDGARDGTAIAGDGRGNREKT